ncbi:MAG: hypothetical protein IJT97_05950 [Bacteroidaceae bacterium]|nr:hypothetical protein [Bacteroidaceae bacterium]
MMLIRTLLTTLVSTILIELGVLWLLRERRKKVLWASVAVNVLTNVPLNLFLLCVQNGLTAIVVGEILVVLVEAAWYCLFVRNWEQAAVYSLLCNAISFLLGLFVYFIWIYFICFII